MPKVRTPTVKRQDQVICAAIEYGMRMNEATNEDIAKTIHASRMTLYRRMCNPEEFTLGELRSIAGKLHTTVEKLINGQT